MPVNVEVKARVRDRALIEARALRLAGCEPQVLSQVDTFFPVSRGRLKLREENGRAVLISYLRADQASLRTSTYAKTPIPEPDLLEAMLAGTLGETQVVRKLRHLYRVGNSRVHLDRVEGLGDFVEIETEVERAGSPEQAAGETRALLRELGIGPEDLVADAYVDLLEAGEPG
ncbi:MAG: class IV adenylate cyclase [bacterium]|nr:class IV adenylate cyclase [bacterium]